MDYCMDNSHGYRREDRYEACLAYCVGAHGAKLSTCKFANTVLFGLRRLYAPLRLYKACLG